MDPFDSARYQQPEGSPRADSWAVLPTVSWGLGGLFRQSHHPELVESAPPRKRDSVAHGAQANVCSVFGGVDGVRWLLWKDRGTEEGKHDGK